MDLNIHARKGKPMKKQAQSTTQLGDLVAAAFDTAARCTADPLEVSRLATRAIAKMLQRAQSTSIAVPLQEYAHAAERNSPHRATQGSSSAERKMNLRFPFALSAKAALVAALLLCAPVARADEGDPLPTHPGDSA